MEYSNLQDKLDQFQNLQTIPNRHKNYTFFMMGESVRLIPCRQEEHVAMIQQT